jgi:hypothetical protein
MQLASYRWDFMPAAESLSRYPESNGLVGSHDFKSAKEMKWKLGTHGITSFRLDFVAFMRWATHPPA